MKALKMIPRVLTAVVFSSLNTQTVETVRP